MRKVPGGFASVFDLGCWVPPLASKMKSRKSLVTSGLDTTLVIDTTSSLRLGPFSG